LTLAGKGVLAIWNGIDAEAEAEFIAWHIQEHIPERVSVPGFLRGRRYVAERGSPKYFNFYETEATDTLVSPAYVERLNAPSDWTKAVVKHFTDTSRTICTVAGSRGLGDGGFVATLRLRAGLDRGRFLEGLNGLVDQIVPLPAIVAIHVLEGQGGGSNGQTAEKALRSRPDDTVDWILLVEAAESVSLESALDRLATALSMGGLAVGFEPQRDCGIYRLQFGLARSQLA
jgi:hypothetical protein